MNDNLDRALLLLKTLGKFDTGQLAERMSPDVRYWVAGMPRDQFIDRDSMIGALQQVRSAVFDGPIEFTIHATTVEGGRVAIEATSEAKLRNGQAYGNVYHFLFEFDDGKLILGREYADTKLLDQCMQSAERP